MWCVGVFCVLFFIIFGDVFDYVVIVNGVVIGFRLVFVNVCSGGGLMLLFIMCIVVLVVSGVLFVV